MADKNISLWKVEEFLIDNLKELPMGNGKFKLKAECSLEELIEKLENYVKENDGEELIDGFHKAMEE